MKVRKPLAKAFSGGFGQAFSEFKLNLGSLLACWVLKTLWCTYRIQIDPTSRERLDKLASPFIQAHWHDQILMATPFVVRRYLNHGIPVGVMISASSDGEFGTRVIQRLRATVVRGSASRGGAAGLRGLIRLIKLQGSNTIIQPDGPRGPLHKAKPGAIAIAQLTATPIVPLGFHCERCWTLGSWDRMRLPKPFARIDVYCGRAFDVPRKLDAEALVSECDTLAIRLTEVRSGPQ